MSLTVRPQRHTNYSEYYLSIQSFTLRPEFVCEPNDGMYFHDTRAVTELKGLLLLLDLTPDPGGKNTTYTTIHTWKGKKNGFQELTGVSCRRRLAGEKSFTVGSLHYVQINILTLIPAGVTEFCRGEEEREHQTRRRDEFLYLKKKKTSDFSWCGGEVRWINSLFPETLLTIRVC